MQPPKFAPGGKYRDSAHLKESPNGAGVAELVQPCTWLICAPRATIPLATMRLSGDRVIV